MESAEPIPVPVLVDVLKKLKDDIGNTEREQIRQLYLAQEGFEFLLDSRNRPQGPTIAACRKIGSAIKRKLGYGPAYGMSVIGYADGSRWVMQRNMRDAISALGWFDDLSSKQSAIRFRNEFEIVPAQFDQDKDFELAVDELLRIKNLPRPSGTKTPAKSTITMPRVERDPRVAAWVRQQAQGKCDCCGKLAPFKNVSDTPFLEVHHIKRLADGGPDTPENAVAVCPNCHRELHHGQHRGKLVADMCQRIERLGSWSN